MVWGFCVYFVYMIPLETDVLRKHRFQKQRQSSCCIISILNNRREITASFNERFTKFCFLSLSNKISYYPVVCSACKQ